MGKDEETEIVFQSSRMESAFIFLLAFDQDLRNTRNGIHLVGWVEGRNPTYRRLVSIQTTKLGFIEQLLSMFNVGRSMFDVQSVHLSEQPFPA